MRVVKKEDLPVITDSLSLQVASKKDASLAGIESGILNFVKSGARRFFIYSDRDSKSKSDGWSSSFLLDDYDRYQTLGKEYWIGLLKTFFTGPRAELRAIPSKEKK